MVLFSVPVAYVLKALSGVLLFLAGFFIGRYVQSSYESNQLRRILDEDVALLAKEVELMRRMLKKDPADDS